MSKTKKSMLMPLLLFLIALVITGCGRQNAPSAQAVQARLSAAELEGRPNFYYHRLSETEQEAYGKIMRRIRSHPERIAVPFLDQESLLRVFQAVSYDNPEILCMDGSCRLVTQGDQHYFVPSYHCSVSECAALTQALLQKAKQVADSVRGKTEYDQELFFHDYLVKHCDYHENTGGWKAYTAAGALLDGKAVCEGYSRAFQLLLNQAGLENYLMTGSARDQDGQVEGHMWNLVTIDGEPYHVDVTWDDPLGNNSQTVSHTYFNLTDQAISANHLTFEPEPPGCDATKANYFAKNDRFFAQYHEAAQTRMAEAIEQSVSQGIWNLEFRFASRREYEKAVADLFSNERIYRLLERANLSGQQIQTNRVQYQLSDDMLVLNLTLEKKSG